MSLNNNVVKVKNESAKLAYMKKLNYKISQAKQQLQLLENQKALNQPQHNSFPTKGHSLKNVEIQHQSKGIENVYEALLTLGLPREYCSKVPNKHFESISEILDILEKYNCLYLAADSLQHTNRDYQIQRNSQGLTIVNTKGTFDLDDAKTDIENVMIFRVINTIYHVQHPERLLYYDELPKVFRDMPVPAPVIFVWALRHYGFNVVLKQILNSYNTKIRYKRIDGKYYPYLSHKTNPRPIEIKNFSGLGAYFALADYAYRMICDIETDRTYISPGLSDRSYTNDCCDCGY